MWFWTTLRKPLYKRAPRKRRYPPGMPEELIDMLTPEHHEVVGFEDFVALIDPAQNILVWERPADEHISNDMLIYQFRDDSPITLGSAIDEFARQVGAPPRPEVPNLFRELMKDSEDA